MDTEGGLPAMIAQLESLPLEYSPGRAWIYSVATDVVGYLVQIVSRPELMPISCGSNILTPLEMADTDFVVPHDKRDRFAACYCAEGRQAGAVRRLSQRQITSPPPKLESGGGGLAGTAADYLRFCRMLLNKGELDGVRLLKPEDRGADDRATICPAAKRSPTCRPPPTPSTKAAIAASASGWAWR